MTLKKFTPQEVAPLFPFWSVKTIRLYVYRGLIPTKRIGGRHFYDEEELKSFVDKMASGEIVFNCGRRANGSAK